MNICAVIMAGGSRTRLWRLSRAAHLKQFVSLHGDDTILQSTVKRLQRLSQPCIKYVAVNAAFKKPNGQ